MQSSAPEAQQKGAAGWSSPVARQAHNLKVAGSNPAPATKKARKFKYLRAFTICVPKRGGAGGALGEQEGGKILVRAIPESW